MAIMGYCANCGNELKDGTQFCPKCGSSVISTQSERDTKQNAELTKTFQHPNEKEEEPGCLSLILFFLIPIAGFFVFASNWRDKPKKADMALFYGLLGMAFSIIFSIIHISVYWEGYCRLAQIITGKF